MDNEQPPPAPDMSDGRGRLSNRAWWIIIGIGIVLYLLVQLLDGGSNGGSSDPDVPDEVEAVTICEQAVEDRLKAPATAEFPPTRDATVTRSGAEWNVEGWVDSENSFGALIRTDFTCTMDYLGDGQWNVSVAADEG